MDEKILEKLRRLQQYVLFLKEIGKTDRDSFTKDFKLLGSAERYLQLSIESCINIGNRILSLTQFKKPVAMPETYGDIFQELYKLGVFSKDFLESMIQMVKFRNRLVHIYWDVDPEMIYDLLKENLTDLEEFKEKIVIYLKKEPL